MKRMSLPSLVIAFSLALLLPIELAHCVWMGVPRSTTAGPMATSLSHACCRAAANARQGQPASSSTPASHCTCIQLPLVTLPSPIAAGTLALNVATILPAAQEALQAPSDPIMDAHERVLLFGSPPCCAESAAHGLRAPPILA